MKMGLFDTCWASSTEPAYVSHLLPATEKEQRSRIKGTWYQIPFWGDLERQENHFGSNRSFRMLGVVEQCY
jgi:hypothetical protein